MEKNKDDKIDSLFKKNCQQDYNIEKIICESKNNLTNQKTD